jgi:sugar lactone lactonase YvrE
VDAPDDLVFGPDGSIYWTDILTGFVRRMTPDGTMTERFVALGVNPITFSRDGTRLFVGLDFLSDGLYELKPDLSDLKPIIECDPNINPFCLGFLNAFEVGPDDRLYGPLFLFNQVVAVDVDLGTVEVIAGFTPGEFDNPASAKFGPDGLLYVLDQGGQVVTIDIDNNNKVTPFTTLQPGLDNMAFDSDGTLYMTNNDEGWVAEILPNRQARIISPGGMIAPQGLGVLEGSNNTDAVFVADIFKLREFDGRNGKQVNSSKGYLIPGVNTLNLPFTLSAKGEELVVSSWFSGDVQIWNPQTENVSVVYGPGEIPIDAITFQDEIVVSDLARGLVWASDNSSPLISLVSPSGLATDGNDLFVADHDTGIIWQISFDGKTPTTKRDLTTGLSSPEGLAYDKEGRSLVVYETGLGTDGFEGRLTRIDLPSGDTTTIVDGLELSGPGLAIYPPTWFFDGVAIGPSGDIYASGGRNNVIYRVPSNKAN